MRFARLVLEGETLMTTVWASSENHATGGSNRRAQLPIPHPKWRRGSDVRSCAVRWRSRRHSQQAVNTTTKDSKEKWCGNSSPQLRY
jgi:hypothetical protein